MKITKLFLSTVFSKIGKIIKYIAMGIFFLGMIVGFPIVILYRKLRLRNDSYYD